jgi:hypothetical protein
MKTGKASKAIAEQEAVAAEARKDQQGKLRRFWLDKGEEGRITFVDGSLEDEGYLAPPRFYEHTVKHRGEWTEFVCVEQTNPEKGEKCPLCEQGERAGLVALFTIIDHRERKAKNSNEVYKDQKRLLVAKPATFELLNKYAVKYGGLAGTTWDVTRLKDDKAPRVGSTFDYVGSTPVKDLQEMFVREVKDKSGKKVLEKYFFPPDYEHEITVYDEQQLRQMGFGNSGVSGSPVPQTFSKAGGAGFNPAAGQEKKPVFSMPKKTAEDTPSNEAASEPETPGEATQATGDNPFANMM